MEFENLRTSNNKYDIYFYETINEVIEEMQLDDNLKEIFLKKFIDKKEKKYHNNFKPIDGFSGPYRGKYLKGYSPQNKGKNFDTLKEAIEAFKKDDFANGITLTRNGKYTIRMSDKLMDSPINSNGSCEISWVIEDRNLLFNSNEKGDFEIITLKGTQYYFNTKNYKIYSMDGKKRWKLTHGSLI